MSLVKELPITEKSKNDESQVPLILQTLTALCVFGLALVLYMSLVYAGSDRMQGNVQRIFYTHFGAFAGAICAFSVTVVGGIAYLRTHHRKWDALALAGVEVGLVMSVVTLVTGMTWARPMWNTWWTWDPRLSSAAIMALTYAAYLMLRAGIESPDKKRLFASVYGILAISTVIFTTGIIRFRADSIHPVVIGPSPVNAQGGFEMAPRMLTALGTSVFVFTCLIVPTLLWWRIRLENLLEKVAWLQSETI